MKRFLAGFVAAAVLFSVPLAFAETPIRLVVNGQEISFPDALPAIINSRVMVPARPLAEALGAEVKWDAETSTVIVTDKVAEAPVPIVKDEPPLTMMVDGVVYYERRQLLALLQTKFPGKTVGTQGTNIAIGFDVYPSATHNWKQAVSYKDVTSLLKAGIITQEELDAAYRL